MTGSRSTYTRKRILDAATRLFAEKGDTTSLREITAEANVNLSSVNYHFGSKEGLIQAVYQQHLHSLNHEQLTILEHLEAQADGHHTLDPVKIVEAYFRPLLRHTQAQPPVLSTHEHVASDPGALIRTLAMDGHAEVLARFHAALLKALPDTPDLELLWRILFMLSAASCSISGMDGLLLALKRPDIEIRDTEMLTERLIPFLVGGLLAPVLDIEHTDAGTMSDNMGRAPATDREQGGRRPLRPE